MSAETGIIDIPADLRGMLSLDIIPGVEIVITGRDHGHMDARFTQGDIRTAQENKLAVASRLDCEQLAVMAVPPCGETFIDLDVLEALPMTWGATVSAPEPVLTGFRTDGLMTSRPNLALGLLPADCAALIMSEGSLLASGHIGRQGAVLGLAEKMLIAMDRKGANVSKLKASFLLGSQSHTVAQRGGRLALPEWDDFTNKVEQGYQIDFVGFAAKSLERRIRPANISMSVVDTKSAPGFFSYDEHIEAAERGEDVPNGRNGIVAVRRN